MRKPITVGPACGGYIMYAGRGAGYSVTASVCPKTKKKAWRRSPRAFYDALGGAQMQSGLEHVVLLMSYSLAFNSCHTGTLGCCVAVNQIVQ